MGSWAGGWTGGDGGERSGGADNPINDLLAERN